jgi:hypothetical protein
VPKVDSEQIAHDYPVITEMWEAFQREVTPHNSKADWYTSLISHKLANCPDVALVFTQPSTPDIPNPDNPVLELTAHHPSATKPSKQKKKARTGRGRSGRKQTTPKKTTARQTTPKKTKARQTTPKKTEHVDDVAVGWSELDKIATTTLAIVDAHKSPNQTVRKHQYATRSRVVGGQSNNDISSSKSSSSSSSNNDSSGPYYTRHEITCESKVDGNVNAFDVRVPIKVSPEILDGLTQSRINHDVVRLLESNQPGPAASVFFCAAPKDDPDPSMPLWSAMTKSVGGAMTFDFGMTGERTLMMVAPESNLRWTHTHTHTHTHCLSLSHTPVSPTPPPPHKNTRTHAHNP